MKKLLIAICILLTITSCKWKSGEQSSEPETPQSRAAAPKRIPVVLPTTGLTLDGLDVAMADTWIGNFNDDPSSSDMVTNVWFSYSWIKEVKKLLTTEHPAGNGTVDGIRIYFAKNAANRNTIVVVSTMYAPGLPDVHIDYFAHQSTYLSTFRASKDFAEDYTGSVGANLYSSTSPCVASNGCVVSTLNHHIGCDKAYNYVQRFGKKPINVVSEWFPLDELKLLYDELSQAATNHVPADGVRVYFAKNGKKRNALILVTTQADAQGNHVDNYNCYVALSKADFKHTYPHLTDDHGEECPINCEGVSWPEQEQ